MGGKKEKKKNMVSHKVKETTSTHTYIFRSEVCTHSAQPSKTAADVSNATADGQVH